MLRDLLQLKYPIVLVHGLGAKRSYGPFEYFHGLPRLLKNSGNRFHIADLTSWQGIETRAEQLKKQIEEHFPEGKVNLVGHSMGGLDCRYLVSGLGFGDRVASVTTIGTPNRGSHMADVVMRTVPKRAIHRIEQMLKLLDLSSIGFLQITVEHYNEVLATKMADFPGVAYFSATSAIPEPARKHSLPIFWMTHPLLKRHEGDNDGFVSVESAKWGEHICTYPGDHYAQVGQFLGRSRGLDYMKFYREIFGRLKKEGF